MCLRFETVTVSNLEDPDADICLIMISKNLHELYKIDFYV